jgi:hypothetical protein
VFFLLLTFLTSSCEKSEELPPEKLILGKWNYYKVITTLYEDNVQKDVWIKTFPQNEVIREYKEDGTGTIYSNDSVIDTFTWAANGDILITNSIELTFTVSKTDLKITWVYEQTALGIVHKQVWEYFFTRV